MQERPDRNQRARKEKSDVEYRSRGGVAMPPNGDKCRLMQVVAEQLRASRLGVDRVTLPR
jgi:hypothetical protein